MKRVFVFLLFFGLFIFINLLFPKTSFAACSGFIAEPNTLPSRTTTTVKIKSQGDCFTPGQSYIIAAHPAELGNDVAKAPIPFIIVPRPPFTTARFINEREIEGDLNLENPGYAVNGDRYSDKNWLLTACIAREPWLCTGDKNLGITGNVLVYRLPASVTAAAPAANQPRIDPTSITQCKYQAGQSVTFKATSIQPNTDYDAWWNEGISIGGIAIASSILTLRSDGSGSDLIFTIPGDRTREVRNNRELCVDIRSLRRIGPNCITLTFTAQPPTGNLACNGLLAPSNTCTDDIIKMCTADNKVCRLGECIAVTKSVPLACEDKTGIRTAIGCIHKEPTELVKELLRFATGIAGGIAFLFMIGGVFQILTSAGNPDALKSGQGILTNAVIGLMFLIFSTLLLKIIGVDILGFGDFFK